jgi:hypothetical protein
MYIYKLYIYIDIDIEREMTHLHVYMCVFMCVHVCVYVCMYICIECDLYNWIPDQFLRYISLKAEQAPGDGEIDWRKRAELSEKSARSLLTG